MENTRFIKIAKIEDFILFENNWFDDYDKIICDQNDKQYEVLEVKYFEYEYGKYKTCLKLKNQEEIKITDIFRIHYI